MKNQRKQITDINTSEAGASYATSTFSIETPQTKHQLPDQEYTRDIFSDVKQYSTSGKIEKSLTYVIKQK